jgi:eukaryotic-like serine/threonine-protein kinase
MIGKSIGHFQIEERLGAGGMGVVYRARDTQLNRPVALKLVGDKYAQDAQARARLLHEAQTASALNHPHICHIYEVGEEADQAYIAMEYVAGKPLAQSIPQEGLPAESVLRYGIQIADAIAHAHDQGVVHRDLKSANVMITPEGRAKVLDFGLARRQRGEEVAEVTRSQVSLAEQSTVSGTLHSIAPEVLRGATADPRSDVWALGVLLYEMAAGCLPFQGKTGFEMSSAILREQPTPLPPHVPAALRAVILRCLAKEPAQRYARASEVRASLETIQSSEESIPVATASLAPASERWFNSTKFFAVIGGLIVVIVVFSALLGLVWRDPDVAWRIPFSGARKEAPIRSLAVLPMKNLSATGGEDVLGLGMADTIITKVSQIGALTVRPTSAVQKYARQETDALEAARQLGVDSVLDGSVQRSGDRLRINVNLLRVRDGASLWSDTFNVSASDIFATQDEIAQKVVSGLRLQLDTAEQARLAKHFTSNPAAFDFYVRGMRALDRRTFKADAEPLNLAMAMFGKAIEADPNYALAHAQLAYSYAWMALFVDATPSWVERAKTSLARADALDAQLAESHVVRYELAWSAFEGFNIDRAIEELQLAQKLNPSIGHDHLGILLAHLGLEEPAIREMRRSMEIDPQSDIARSRMVETYDLMVRPQEALKEQLRLFHGDISPIFVRKSFFWTGQFAKARALIDSELAARPKEPMMLSERALYQVLTGDAQSAEAAIPTFVELGKQNRAFHHITYNVACIYALQGKAAEAVKWLRTTVDTGMPNYTLFDRDPHLDKIRKDPGFMQFMAELKPRFDKYQQEFR